MQRGQMRYQKRQRGVTMIELAIVLGVAGILIGGIWVAASAAYDAQRVNQTVDQVRQIVENVRGRYTTAAQIPQQSYTALTQTMASSDLFPAETWVAPGGDPANCAAAAPCYFIHPWSSDGAGSVCGGGTYCVGSIGNLLVVMQGNTNSAFVLLLRKLPQAACIHIAAKLVALWDEIGISAIGFNNGDAVIPATPLQAPPALTTIEADCAAGNDNSLYVSFRQTP